MWSDQLPSNRAADLTVALASLTEQSAFKRSVWRRMTPDERRQLFALRQQALYGDAPHASSSFTAERSSGNSTSKPASASALTTQLPPELRNTGDTPHRLDFAAKARHQSWVNLRGAMTPQVACETFCAELLSLLEKYPEQTLATQVESALSRAQFPPKRPDTDATLRSSRLTEEGRSVSPSVRTGLGEEQAENVFLVHALQGDPAVSALLWICRAYAIPCELTLEPLSVALPPSPPAGSAAPSAAQPAGTDSVPTVLASDDFPFEAVVCRRVYTAHHDGAVPTTKSSGDAKGPTAVRVLHSSTVLATVSDPVAAFALLLDQFLPNLPHWVGVSAPSAAPAMVGSSSRASPATPATAQRSVWLDTMQQISRHVRGPLLALLVDAAAREQRTVMASPGQAPLLTSHTVEVTQRAALVQSVADHLYTFVGLFVRQLPSFRRNEGAQGSSLLALPLTETAAVLSTVEGSFTQRLVTGADLFLASCGYCLCTHPHCKDLFPIPPPGEVLAASRGVVSAASLYSFPATQSLTTAAGAPGVTGDYSTSSGGVTLDDKPLPGFTPVRLQGLSHEESVLLNRVLAGEATSAITSRHEKQQQQQVHVKNAESTTGVTALPFRLLSPAPAMAQKVEKLIFELILNVADEDTRRSTTTSTWTPLTLQVLARILALSWGIGQEQCVGFPYLLLDPRSRGGNGLAFLVDLAVSERAKMASAGSSGTRPGDGFHVRRSIPVAANGSPVSTPSAAVASSLTSGATIETWQGRLRSGWGSLTRMMQRYWRFSVHVEPKAVATTSTAKSEAASSADRRRVLRSGGGDDTAVSKL